MNISDEADVAIMRIERRNFMEKFIENLHFLLSEKSMTKNQFLKNLHLGKNSIYNWKNRNTLPNGSTLIAIADYFDVSLDYLVGRTDDPILHKK